MTQSGRDWFYAGGVVAALIVLWYFAHQKPVAQAPGEEAFPQAWDSPMVNVYNANPQAYLPPDDATLTITIGNQLPSMLSDQYIPLFGFVGIAQGQMFL